MSTPSSSSLPAGAPYTRAGPPSSQRPGQMTGRGVRLLRACAAIVPAAALTNHYLLSLFSGMLVFQPGLTVDDDGTTPRTAEPQKERRRTMAEETRIQQGEDPTQPGADPTQDREELTDAELDQVAGGGGHSTSGDF